jgi:hypothetical protein
MLATAVDDILSRSSHPIVPVIRSAGGAHALEHCIRYQSDAYEWIQDAAKASTTAGNIAWKRIGTTLYSFRDNVSHGATFEFDADHSHECTPEQLESIIATANRLPGVLAVRSTSGTGVHVFIPWASPVECTKRHHTALSAAAAKWFCREAGIPADRVCGKGGNMWIARVDAPPTVFEPLTPFPAKRLTPDDIPDVPTPTEATKADPVTEAELSPEQRADLDTLRKAGHVCEYVAGVGWRIHTATLHLIDPSFRTSSPGTDLRTANGYMVPRDDGTWHVFRYGQPSEPTWRTSADGQPYAVLCEGRGVEFDFSWHGSDTVWGSDAVATSTAGESHDGPRFLTLDMIDLFEQHPSMNEPVIHNLLRRGEIANLIAAPKIGKSWTAYHVALSVASGRQIFNTFDTVKGRVLILDNELHHGTLSRRLRTVADAMGVVPQRGMVDIIPLRGKCPDLHKIGRYIISTINARRYSLIIIDALYRVLPAGRGSENDNATITGVYNILDEFAARTDSAYLLLHHSSKGDQSAKDVTDVGAGAGAMVRATDAHTILRPHEQPGHVVFEARPRTWATPTEIVLRWDFPLFRPADGLDPCALASPKSRQQQNRDAEGQNRILATLANGPATATALTKATGIYHERMGRLLSQLLSAESIAKRDDGPYPMYELPA